MGEKEKVLVASIFSCTHNSFYGTSFKLACVVKSEAPQWIKQTFFFLETRCVFETWMSLQQPFFFLWHWYFTLTIDINIGTKEKVLPFGVNMWNTTALSFIIKKLWPMFFFNVTLIFDFDLDRWHCPCYWRKCLATKNTHVKYVSFISYHSKVMANVKISADQQINRVTDRATLYMPSDLSMLGHFTFCIWNSPLVHQNDKSPVFWWINLLYTILTYNYS